MGRVLARVTSEIPTERGPDVEHGIRVPQGWLEGGVTIEVDLPRTMTCATCHGGGCDACDRSGAVSLRERSEEPERLTVTLPQRDYTGGPRSSVRRGMVVRIPDRGGFPDPAGAARRGILLLSIRPASNGEVVDGIRLPDHRPARPTGMHPSAPQRVGLLGIPTWGWIAAALVALAWALVLSYCR